MRLVRRLGSALSAAIVFALAACGGGDDSAGPGPVPAGQSAQGTLGAAGGNVVLSSSDGSVVALSVPAGALTKSTTIAISTATATSAQHFSLHLEPQGLVLDGGLAATLTITLRADAPLPAKGGLLYDGVPTAFTRLPDGRLQVLLTHFAGTAPASARGRAQTQSVHALTAPSAANCSPQLGGSDGSLTADDAIEIELYGQCMVAAVNALAANAQYAAAVRLASATAAYLQAAGVGDAAGFVTQASGIACIAYRDALSTARSTPVTTMGTLYTVLKPVLFWEGVRQGFGATCSGVGPTDFMDVTNTKTGEAAAFYATQKPALTDTTSPQYAAAAGEASAAHDTVTQVRSLQPGPAVQSVLTTQIEQRAEPSLLDAMLQAPWQRCHDSGDYGELIRLMELMNHPQAVKDAAQYCATQLSAQARDSSGAVTATLAPTQGGSSAAQRNTTGALQVSRDGKLSLTGPIGALQCPADSSGGSESLLIKLDGTTVQTINAAPYLQAQLDIIIQSALTAAGIADTAAQATLTVERTGTPCDGYWGGNPAPLLTLILTWGQPRILFVGSTPGTSGVAVINADGTGRTQLTSDAVGASSSPSWSPDGKRIAFTRIRGNAQYAVVMNADGSGQTEIAVVSGFYVDGTPWSPDGSKLLYFVYDSLNRSSLYVMNADGTGQTLLTTGVGYPAWSPDGRRIAYLGSVRNSSVQEIFVMSADGSGATQLTFTDPQGSPFNASPTWSPDGTRIAFGRRTDLPTSNGPQAYAFGIYSIGAGGGAELKLADNGIFDSIESSSAWSPDGQRILYLNVVQGSTTFQYTSQIALVNASGSGQVVLTSTLPGSAGDRLPSWSPDGSQIGFWRNNAGSTTPWSLQVMKADGTATVRLLDQSQADGPPAWSPK